MLVVTIFGTTVFSGVEMLHDEYKAQLLKIAAKYHVSYELVKEISYTVAYGGKYFQEPEALEEEIRDLLSSIK